ncbi:MAG TPA: hypothetical protein VGR54_07195 [Nitrosopumilaceae archaeon]|nr:hypothetical protein [Nitrosopumilaceae archaeon]
MNIASCLPIVIILVATLFLFNSPAFAQQASSSQLVKIPITFHFPDKDVKATLDPTSVNVLFNPKEYIVTKSVKWPHHDVTGSDSPALEFTSGQPTRLSFELFFDTYEEGKSVRELTDKIEKLSLVNDPHRPPQCMVKWGSTQFKCILESFSTKYTLFLDNGTPVRATMHLVFKEFSPVNEQLNHYTIKWKDLLPLLDASGNSPWLFRSYDTISLDEIPKKLFGDLKIQQTTSTLSPPDQTAVQGFMIKIVGSERTTSNSWDIPQGGGSLECPPGFIFDHSIGKCVPQGGGILVSVSDNIIDRALFTSWQSGQIGVSQSGDFQTGDFEPLDLKGPLAKVKSAIESWIENHPAPCTTCKDVTFGFSGPDGKLIKEYRLSVLDVFYFKNQILLLSIQPDDMLHVTLLNIERTRADGSAFSGPPRIFVVLPTSGPLFFPLGIGGTNFDQSAIPYFGTIPGGQLFNFGLNNLPLIGSIEVGFTIVPPGAPSGAGDIHLIYFGQKSNTFSFTVN